MSAAGLPVAFRRPSISSPMSCVHLPLAPAFLDRVVAESGKLPARVRRYVIDGIVAFDGAGELETIRCPTLILWGDRDAIFARAEQERLRDGIPGATLVVYPDTGHALHWERPGRFARDLRTFVHSGGRCA